MPAYCFLICDPLPDPLLYFFPVAAFCPTTHRILVCRRGFAASMGKSMRLCGGGSVACFVQTHLLCFCSLNCFFPRCVCVCVCTFAACIVQATLLHCCCSFHCFFPRCGYAFASCIVPTTLLCFCSLHFLFSLGIDLLLQLALFKLLFYTFAAACIVSRRLHTGLDYERLARTIYSCMSIPAFKCL